MFPGRINREEHHQGVLVRTTLFFLCCNSVISQMKMNSFISSLYSNPWAGIKPTTFLFCCVSTRFLDDTRVERPQNLLELSFKSLSGHMWPPDRSLAHHLLFVFLSKEEAACPGFSSILWIFQRNEFYTDGTSV